MKITYDKKVDAMYIKLRKGRYDHTKKGEVLGLEILDASKNVGKVKPEKVAVEFSSVSP